MITDITLRGTGEFNEVSSTSQREMLVMASLKAPFFEKSPEDKRAPIDICCVLDRSGSMMGEKLELVKRAMLFVLDNLDPADALSVVTFESGVETLFNFTKMDKKGKEMAAKAIEKIVSAGSTNLLGGLICGLELVNQRTRPSDISSVLLFTDGQADGGQTTERVTMEMEKTLADCPHKKPTVFTFGFGRDHNEGFLRSIAEAGSGMYYFVEDVDKIPVSFADCLGGLQSVVAQNLTLLLEGAQEVKIIKSLSTKYKITKGALPAASITMELGDLYSEEERDIIFVIQLPELDAPDALAKECLNFSLNYFNVLLLKDAHVVAKVMISRPEAESKDQKPNEVLDKHRNRLRVADAMERSRALAERGDLEGARELLKKEKEVIQESASSNDEYCVKLSKELDDCVVDMVTREQYNAKGSKAMMRKAQAHQFQRSNRNDDDDVDFYETSAKMSSKKKARGF